MQYTFQASWCRPGGVQTWGTANMGGSKGQEYLLLFSLPLLISLRFSIVLPMVLHDHVLLYARTVFLGLEFFGEGHTYSGIYQRFDSDEGRNRTRRRVGRVACYDYEHLRISFTDIRRLWC